MNRTLVALVPAAGSGTRAGLADGLPKQYRQLAGETLLRRAVRALLADARIGQVRVAVAPGDPWVAQALAGLPRVVWRACGGPARADTVRAALADAALADDDWVLVHDAARPGLPAAALARLIDTCWRYDCGGLLAWPVADTVKRAGAVSRAGSEAGGKAEAGAGVGASAEVGGEVEARARGGSGAEAGVGTEAGAGGEARVEALARVAATLPRDALWLAQTPQMFRAGELRAALAATAGDLRVTDEASAMELAGPAERAPLLVRGARENDKLTWPEDFGWFERWLDLNAHGPRGPGDQEQ